jgi:hypothetical protein
MSVGQPLGGSHCTAGASAIHREAARPMIRRDSPFSRLSEYSRGVIRRVAMLSPPMGIHASSLYSPCVSGDPPDIGPLSGSRGEHLGK